MTQEEALRMALEALKSNVSELIAENKALKEALAQAQEPIKNWIASHNDICVLLRQAHDALALTSYPPQRTWVDMTDDEMLMIYMQKHDGKKYSLGRMVQAKLKQKNTRGQE